VTVPADRSLKLPRAVVFDLDGTLVDSLPDIAAAMNATLAADGKPTLPELDIRAMIGAGSDAAIERALVHLGLAADAVEVARLGRAFLPHYIAASRTGSQLFPGVVDVLQQLQRGSVACGLCTNKLQAVTEVVVTASGIGPYLGAVIGATPALPKKPAADMLLAAIAGLGASPADTVMVGDSIADVGTARAAGIPVILVDFGYTRTPVHELGADAVISHLNELAKALSDVRVRCR
jgi:phosphoglycolate phosphatase